MIRLSRIMRSAFPAGTARLGLAAALLLPAAATVDQTDVLFSDSFEG